MDIGMISYESFKIKRSKNASKSLHEYINKLINKTIDLFYTDKYRISKMTIFCKRCANPDIQIVKDMKLYWVECYKCKTTYIKK